MNEIRLLLASASPRRLDLLRRMGLAPLVHPSTIDERPLEDESPERMVARLAEAKGRAVIGQAAGVAEPLLVLAADTAVVIEGQALGKPRSPAEARAMLRLLRGKTHQVLTGVFLCRTDDGRSAAGVETTLVRFRAFDEKTLDEYVASGEPMDKAGAYAIQGGGGQLAESVQGSWSNVVGLPTERLQEWLAKIGVTLADLGAA